MASYQPPMRDYRFILEQLLDIYQQPKLQGFDEIDPELVNAILEGMADFSTGVMLPLNSVGDLQGCRLEADGVKTAEGFIDAYRQYVDNGWPTLTCDPEFGGQGLPEVVGIFATEMQTSSNMAFAMYPGLTHGAYSAIFAHGSEALKAKYLPKLVSGEWTGTMNLTESHAGTDLALLRTKAEPGTDGCYLISGEKIFISSGDHDLAENIVHLVLARLPDAPAGVKGISLFAVPKYWVKEDGSLGEANNVKASGLEHKMGIHGNSTCVMLFDGAKGELVGEPHQGLRAMFTMMNQARMGVGVQGLGVSEIAYQNALAYARERVQGRALSGTKAPEQNADPILVHGDVRRMLLSQKVFNEGARALIGQQALWLDEAERHQDAEQKARAKALAALFTPVVKGFITDRGFSACVDAQQVFGGHGYIHEWGMEQFVRDARIAMIYEGTNGVQALDLVGRKLMGDKGAALKLWAAEVEAFIEGAKPKAAQDPRFAKVLEGLGQAATDLQRATQSLMELAMKNPDNLGAASMPYMQLFGTAALAWIWARMAELALDGLADDADGFYAGKLASAGFFMDYYVSSAGGYRRQIAAASESIMAFDDSYFG
ncbi:acyl-CoA dehydrogenase C-terminal domain-containing protein [Shewanella chilikensis]|uniref:acyl-CoA dehydrogenase C-terminal domain-containing protein n=1 Tax=Shewanella chilikensis TaxID=558541 RepID=UPI003999E914